MFEKVCEILAGFTEVPVSEIRMESNLASDLGINSLDIMGAVVAFEEEFSEEIPDRVVWKMRTIGDIVAFLENGCI